MSVNCLKGCGKTWPRHPAREVRCPSCGAKVGRRRTRPSGHTAADYHQPRYVAAYDAGHFGTCPWECCRPNERPLPSEKAGADLPIFQEATR